MIRRRPITTIIILILAFGGSVAGLIWGNYLFSRNLPGGSNFFVDWYSARSLFIDGVNPYSETARSGMFSSAAREGIQLIPGAHYASPLYAAFVTLPFATISDYTLARAVWMTLMEVCLIALVFMALNLAHWPIKPLPLGLLVLFALFWFHGLEPLITGNMGILVAFLITGIFLAIRARHYELAGVLLGFATIEPHAMLLFALFVVIWSFQAKHAKLTGWFLATVVLIGATSALIRPRWVMDYLSIIIHPSNLTPTISAVLQSFLPAAGRRLGIILSSITGLILLVEWFISKKKDFEGFYWTGLLTLALSPWIGLPTEPGVFIVVFPAIIFSYYLWLERWPRVGIVIVGVATLLLFAGIWMIYLPKAGTPTSAIAGLFFAQPLLVTIMLYWVRWWAIRKPKVWYDIL